jgi:hypothetical protein
MVPPLVPCPPYGRLVNWERTKPEGLRAVGWVEIFPAKRKRRRPVMGGAPTLGWGLGGLGGGSHSLHAKRGWRLEPATLSDRAARHDGQPPRAAGVGWGLGLEPRRGRPARR